MHAPIQLTWNTSSNPSEPFLTEMYLRIVYGTWQQKSVGVVGVCVWVMYCVNSKHMQLENMLWIMDTGWIPLISGQFLHNCCQDVLFTIYGEKKTPIFPVLNSKLKSEGLTCHSSSWQRNGSLLTYIFNSISINFCTYYGNRLFTNIVYRSTVLSN